MVEYINQSLPFQKKQVIPENDILYPIGFLLPRKW